MHKKGVTRLKVHLFENISLLWFDAGAKYIKHIACGCLPKLRIKLKITDYQQFRRKKTTLNRICKKKNTHNVHNSHHLDVYPKINIKSRNLAVSFIANNIT